MNHAPVRPEDPRFSRPRDAEASNKTLAEHATDLVEHGLPDLVTQVERDGNRER
jgi:hypothetical protein